MASTLLTARSEVVCEAMTALVVLLLVIPLDSQCIDRSVFQRSRVLLAKTRVQVCCQGIVHTKDGVPKSQRRAEKMPLLLNRDVKMKTFPQ